MNIQKVQYVTFLDSREKADGVFELLKPLYASILINNQWYECVIPAGFVTDFCSVPRVPLAYTLFGGKYNRTGTLHDGLYGTWSEIKILHAVSRVELPITKKLADSILYRSLLNEGASWFTASAMWSGVNMFGSQYFKRGLKNE
jgi:hypothetical protein